MNRKFLTAGILAVFGLFLPSKSHAVPLDIPNAQVVDGTATNSVQLSTVTFPVAVSTGAVAYGWCFDRIVVSVPSDVQSNFTIFYATQSVLTAGTLVNATTNFMVVTASATEIYDMSLDYREPYCAPPGTYVTLFDNIAGAIISFEAYVWKGWNP
jgi:hypothetical protein